MSDGAGGILSLRCVVDGARQRDDAIADGRLDPGFWNQHVPLQRRTHGLGDLRIARLRGSVRLDLEVVGDVTYAGDSVSCIAGGEALRPARDRSRQGDDPVMDLNAYFGLVDTGVPLEL